MKIRCTYSALLDVKKIKPHPKNPNKHTKDQIERLAKIIDYQGQRSPVIISNLSGFVVVGHGRLEAMKKLGWKEVAVDYQDFEDEAQEYAHLTADNAIAEWAQLDLSQINNELQELGPEFDIDFLALKDFTIEPLEKFEMEDELREDMNKKFLIEVTFPNDMEMMDIHDDLVSRGYIVKIK